MKSSLVLVLALLVSGVAMSPVFAQQIELTDLDPERCTDVLAEVSAIQTESPSSAVSLVAEALRRYCAGTGGIVMPDDLAQALTDEDSRSLVEGDESISDEVILVAEAAYYLEIAQQVDAGAANDLLRRLLGSEPNPGK